MMRSFGGGGSRRGGNSTPNTGGGYEGSVPTPGAGPRTRERKIVEALTDYFSRMGADPVGVAYLLEQEPVWVQQHMGELIVHLFRLWSLDYGHCSPGDPLSDLYRMAARVVDVMDS